MFVLHSLNVASERDAEGGFMKRLAQTSLKLPSHHTSTKRRTFSCKLLWMALRWRQRDSRQIRPPRRNESRKHIPTSPQDASRYRGALFILLSLEAWNLLRRSQRKMLIFCYSQFHSNRCKLRELFHRISIKTVHCCWYSLFIAARQKLFLFRSLVVDAVSIACKQKLFARRWRIRFVFVFFVRLSVVSLGGTGECDSDLWGCLLHAELSMGKAIGRKIWKHRLQTN